MHSFKTIAAAKIGTAANEEIKIWSAVIRDDQAAAASAHHSGLLGLGSIGHSHMGRKFDAAGREVVADGHIYNHIVDLRIGVRNQRSSGRRAGIAVGSRIIINETAADTELVDAYNEASGITAAIDSQTLVLCNRSSCACDSGLVQRGAQIASEIAAHIDAAKLLRGADIVRGSREAQETKHILGLNGLPVIHIHKIVDIGPEGARCRSVGVRNLCKRQRSRQDDSENCKNSSHLHIHSL